MAVVTAEYTSRLLKGGALLEDTRQVVELWDQEQSPEDNLARISNQNLLAKRSVSRLEDILYTVVRPRYIEPGPHVMTALKAILSEPQAFRDACYYESARADQLLGAFARGPICDWWQQGRLKVNLDDAMVWLDTMEELGRLPQWTPQVRTRVAQGLLSTLRDFGVLTGVSRGQHKEISPSSISPRGFIYATWRLQEQGASSRALAASPVWRQWLLDEAQVEERFAQAARLGVLRISRAGSAVRVDWLKDSLEGAVAATA